MKSKAHSKKCMEMGVPDGLIDDQDAEDSGTVLCSSGFSLRELHKSHNFYKMNSLSVKYEFCITTYSCIYNIDLIQIYLYSQL